MPQARVAIVSLDAEEILGLRESSVLAEDLAVLWACYTCHHQHGVSQLFVSILDLDVVMVVASFHNKCAAPVVVAPVEADLASHPA